MVDILKIITMREIVLSELGAAAPRPVVRAVGMAVIRNPFAGQCRFPRRAQDIMGRRDT